GFRVEPGEIESVLAGCEGVAQAAVVVREDRPGDRRLAAYLVGADLDVAAVRRFAAARLPDYLIPSFTVLDALPLTVNDKLDRDALPAPAAAAPAGRAPRSPRARRLCGPFAGVRGGAKVGVADGSSALGGDALPATGLASRIRSARRAELPVRALFEAPPPADLAARLADAAGEVRPPLVRAERPDMVPLSYAQQRLWFLNRLDGRGAGNAAATGNMPIALRLEG